MKTIRLLIVDDHPIFRHGLRALLNSVEGLEIVGEAATGEEAVVLALAHKPDVILMDIQMPGPEGAPGINGIEATRRIVKAEPQTGVLMLTMFEEDDSIFAAMRAGARGYLLKGCRQDEALRAIQAVASGEVIFGPQAAEKVRLFFSRAPLSAPPLAFPELTERELQILELLAQRLNNQEIAKRLSLSPKTVRNYASNIFDKLQVAGRSEAILAARAAGLGQNTKRDV
jgi:DNA-binding NarL/FixJ family response regulator